MKKIQSTCNYCAIDCNLDFYVEDNKIVKTVPTKGYPVNDGFSCIKGLSLSKQQTTVKPNSLPKIRQKDGSFKEVSWDEAFTHVASELNRIQAEYGTESVAGISTGQLTLEEFAIFGHVMRNYLQTNVDGNTRLCMATAVVAHKQSYGFDAPGYTLKDLELSDTLIFIGSNPVVAHPIVWGRVRQNQVPGHKIIVIDPRKSETAMNADYHYELKPRTDLLLLYTVAHLLIENDYLDHDFIREHTEHFDEFKDFVKTYTLERAVDGTGLSKEQILELVELINANKLDFAVTYKPANIPPLIEVKEFNSPPLCVVAHKDHPVSVRKTFSLEDIGDYPLILFPHSIYTRTLIDKMLQQHKVSVTPQLEINSTPVILDMVRTGHWISILSKDITRNNPDLRAIQIKGCVECMHASLLFLKGKRQSIMAEKLLEMMKIYSQEKHQSAEGLSEP